MGLNETVVVGYGTLNRREVTSAITHVSDKDLLAVGGNNPDVPAGRGSAALRSQSRHGRS